MIFSQYFGNYLLEKGIITLEQFKEAIEKQTTVHLKIGVLAIDSRYMTTRQVEDVTLAQKSVDKWFGEIAVDKGYLTESQLEELLSRQVPEHVLLSQVLVNMGILDFARLEQAMDQYRKEEGFTEKEFEALKKNDVDLIVSMFTDAGHSSEHRIYHEYITLFVKNIVRFIDSEIKVEEEETLQSYRFGWLVWQGMKGDGAELYTAISAPENVLLTLAGRFAGMAISSMGELATASLGEFMNCHNGIFLSNMYDAGISLELLPQQSRKDGSVRSQGDLFRIPLRLGIGPVDLILSSSCPEFE